MLAGRMFGFRRFDDSPPDENLSIPVVRFGSPRLNGRDGIGNPGKERGSAIRGTRWFGVVLEKTADSASVG